MSIFKRAAGINGTTSSLFPLTVFLMETFWVYPWLILIGRWPVFVEQHTPVTPGSIIFLLGFSFLVTRLIDVRGWRLSWTRLTSIVLGMASILLVIRVEYPGGFQVFDPSWLGQIIRLVTGDPHPSQALVAAVLGLYLWWRGIRLGHSSLFFEDVYRYFSIGLIAQIALILAWGTGPHNNLMLTIGPYIAVFFFFGLSALALAKLNGAQERRKDEGGAIFNTRWLSIIMAVIGGIIVVGIAFAGIFSNQFVTVISQIFNLLAGILFKIIFYISAVIVIIATFFLSVGFYLFQLIMDALVGKMPPGTSSSGNMTAIPSLNQIASQSLTSEATQVIKIIVFVLLFAALVFIIVRSIIRNKPRQEKGDVEEINESLWSWNRFTADLKFYFTWLWQHFRKKVRTILPEGTRRRPQPIGVETDEKLSIREIYRRLLKSAAEFGVTRRRQETPYEYGRRLGQVVPETHQPLNELTDLYISVRYGEVSSESVKENQANSIWNFIKRFFTKEETSHPG